MKTSTKRLENAIVEIEVKFDKDEFAVAVETAIDKLAKSVKVDGFRQGKVPPQMARARVSKDMANQEALDTLLQKNYAEILTSNDVTPLAQPMLDVKEMSEKGLTITFNVPVKPTVELGAYKGLEVKKAAVKVAKKDIDAKLNEYQQQFATMSVKKTAIKAGDTAVIDFEGFKDGVAFDGGAGQNYPLEIGSGSFIPGFEDQLVGLKAGEDKDVEVTFPKDYQAEDLAGKAVVFKVKVHEVKGKKLPAIDDELAKDVNIEGVDTLEQLTDKIKADLKETKTYEADAKFDEEIIDTLIKNSNVEESEPLIQKELELLMQEMEQNLQRQGVTFELYEQFTGKTKADLLEDSKPRATERFKLNFILEAIVEAEKLEATDKEIDAEMENIATMYGRELEEIKSILGANMDQLKSDMLVRKALSFVKENVK